MDDRINSLDERAVTAERAAEWLSRLEKAGPREKESFLKWLDRSPENGGEVLAAVGTDLVLRGLFRGKRMDVDRYLSASANVIPVGDRENSQRRPARTHRLRFIASLGLGLAAAAAALLIVPTPLRDLLHPNQYTTSIGEQRAVELPDGSAISINAQSSVRVAFSDEARDVYLNAGQAMFTVAKDPSRPFRVHVLPTSKGPEGVRGAVIQALGTKFDVRRRPDRINVAVIEGVVQIRSDTRDGALDAALTDIVELARVAAGEAVSIENTGLVTPPAPVSASDVSAWQQRRLVFADSTLEEIAEEFQRYNRTPRIRIEGDELRMRRLSGVFDADNPEALFMYLASDRTIVLDQGDDEFVIRLRPVIVQSNPSQ